MYWSGLCLRVRWLSGKQNKRPWTTDPNRCHRPLITQLSLQSNHAGPFYLNVYSLKLLNSSHKVLNFLKHSPKARLQTFQSNTQDSLFFLVQGNFSYPFQLLNFFELCSPAQQTFLFTFLSQKSVHCTMFFSAGC